MLYINGKQHNSYTLWELQYGKYKDPIRERQFYESILRQKHNSKSNKKI